MITGVARHDRAHLAASSRDSAVAAAGFPAVWISVEGRPADDLGPAFPYAWDVRLGLRSAGVAARLFSVALEWGDLLAASGPLVVFPIEETSAEPGFEADPVAVRRRVETAGLPYVGSTADAVVATRDKAAARDRLRAAGIPVAAGLCFPEPVPAAEAVRRYAAHHPFPAVAKPACGGNSVGVAYAAEAEALRQVMERWRWDEHGAAIVEEYVRGPEYTVWVAGVGDDLSCRRIAPIDRGGHPIFNRAAKVGVVCEDTSGDDSPPPSPGMIEAAARAAVAGHRALGLYSYSRADVILGEEGPVVLEVNARPHLSFTGQVTVADGDEAAYGGFLCELVEHALRRPVGTGRP